MFRFLSAMGSRRPRHRINSGMGGYNPEWELKALPGYASAQQFAYETLSLKPKTLHGYAVPVATMVCQPPQIEHVQQVRLDGYGLPAGTMVLPQLYDPSANLAPISK